MESLSIKSYSNFYSIPY